jgi:hypothetical protein
MKFRVRVKNSELPVEFDFATKDDLNFLNHWRSTRKQRGNPFVQDALEYSRHVNKGWRVYEALGRTVTTLAHLRQSFQQNQRAEVVFLMVARALWHEPSSILGFCFCRRTWCHHIILDFAASHPNAIRKAGGEVQGVGLSMLYSLVKIAEGLGVKTVWGEATENSHGFYEVALALKSVSDQFFINGNIFEHCLRQYKIVVGDDNS